MKILHRSVSNYQKPQKSNVSLPKRQVSVPCNWYQQELYDEAKVPTQLPANVLECIRDASGLFTKVYTRVINYPESIDPDYTPENLHPNITDAKLLIPVISLLITDTEPDGLLIVRDIITRIRDEKPTLEPQYVEDALHAVKNAIVLLHLDEDDDIDVNALITQPREIIAAVIIVNMYLKNLSGVHS